MAAGTAAVAARAGAGAGAVDVGLELSRMLPPVLALALSFWNIAVPSYWRDEAATIAAVSRPLASLPAMLGNVDAVHGTYYLMMWPLARMFGTGELALRFPSAVATAIAAAAVAAIGRRLVSSWAGVAAGVLFAVLPEVSRYGETARSYALVIAAATVASWLLIGLLPDERPAGHRGRRGSRAGRFTAYAASLTLLGALNIFGLLLIPAHGTTVALRWWRHRGDVRSGRLAAGWLISAGTAAALLVPLLLLGWQQRGQIAWIGRATFAADVRALVGITGSMLIAAVMLAIVVAALLATARSVPGPLTELALPWLVLPPASLLAVSVMHQVFTERYVLICLPPLALICGAALAAFGRIIGTGALALIMIFGWPAQAGQRVPAGHGEDIKAMDKIVSGLARQGDMLVYPNPNADVMGAAYREGLARLPNAALLRGPVQSGTLAGSFVSLAVTRQRLSQASRIWVVELGRLTKTPVMLSLSGAPIGSVLGGLPFEQVQAWRCGTDWLVLYARQPAPAGSGHDRNQSGHEPVR